MRQKKVFQGLAVVGCLLALQAQAPASAPTTLPPDVQQHIDAAEALAGNGVPKSAIGEFSNIPRAAHLPGADLFPAPNHPMQGGAHPVLPPTKAFDQLYYFGNVFVGTWVLATNDGFIQWDTMDNSDEAEHIVEAGYRAMGLDPSKIKYIILTHGHGDHFGGVGYFKSKYPNIHVLASDADWRLMGEQKARPNAHWGSPPERDGTITDGEKLTLGGTTVTLYITPGHTKGTVSSIVPVTDHGVPHMMAIFGGFGLPAHTAPGPGDGGLDLYDQQVQRFTKLAEAAGVDGVVSTHPGFDGTEPNIEALKTRKSGDRNPWIMGKKGFVRFMALDQEMSHAVRALMAHYGER